MRTPLRVAAFAGFFGTWLLLGSEAQGVALPVEWELVVQASGIYTRIGVSGTRVAIDSGGNLGGVMPLPGRERVCVFANCDAAPPSNIVVPLTPVGAGSFGYSAGAVSATVAPWTTGTATAVGLGTTMFTGYAHGPASATGSTAQVGGSLQLITPFTLTTSIAADGPTIGFASLTLRFVPEPTSALLVAGGLVALERWGRSRS